MAVWYVRVMPHYVTMCGTTSTEYIGIETLFLSFACVVLRPELE